MASAYIGADGVVGATGELGWGRNSERRGEGESMSLPLAGVCSWGEGGGTSVDKNIGGGRCVGSVKVGENTRGSARRGEGWEDAASTSRRFLIDRGEVGVLAAIVLSGGGEGSACIVDANEESRSASSNSSVPLSISCCIA